MQTTGKSFFSLYFHIPFCLKKCHYCHFYSIPFSLQQTQMFLNALFLEWHRIKKHLQNKTIVSIYFGGGTPSLLGKQALKQILLKIKSEACLSKACEITLETNPEDVTLRKFQAFQEIGINRVSMGVQSFEDALLKRLGRSHSALQAKKAIDDVYKANINNLSIDLMYDLPHQTFKDWENTLNSTQNLPITHVSLYNLTIEPHTYFFQNKEKIIKAQPKQALSKTLLEKALEFFPKQNFLQYEISAFAKPGYESKHNLGYWSAREFFGLGPSAFSYFQKSRFQNTCNLNSYVNKLKQNQSAISFRETLEPPHHLKELLVIGLRKITGIHLQTFTQTHGALPKETKEELDLLKQEKFLLQKQNQLFLSKKGLYFYDVVAERLI